MRRARQTGRRRLSYCRLNILFLSQRTPLPADRGDRIRSSQWLRHFAVQHEVFLGCLADEAVPDAIEAELSSLCREKCIISSPLWSRPGKAAWSLMKGRSATEGVFQDHRLERVIAAWANTTSFDLVFVFCSSMLPYANIDGLGNVPCIVDLVDVDSCKWEAYADTMWGPWKSLYRCEAARVRDLEQRCARRAAAMILTTNDEAADLKGHCPESPIVVVPNGVDVVEFSSPSLPPTSSEFPVCIFVGVMDYRPNIDAVVWFAREVWPAIIARFPAARFRIVGRNPSPQVMRLGKQQGIEVTGSVPSVHPYLENATLVVAPLRIARGVQNKFLEAMAAGRAVVASTYAATGLEIKDGCHFDQADTSEEWIESVLLVLTDTAYRESIAAAGRRYVLERHRWAGSRLKLDDIVRSVTSEAICAP